MLFLFGRFNMIQHDSTRKLAARHCCHHLVARASPHSKMKRCLAGGILANQCFEILLPTALISQQDFERIYVTTRMSLFSGSLSLSTKPHWSPTSTTLPVAIKCCQHFTMVCYILPSGLVGCCSLLALCVCLGALAWQAAAWLSKSATLPEDVGAPNSSFKVSTSASSATFCSPHWWSNRFASLARMQWFTNVYDEMRWWDDMAWHGITLHDMRLGDTTWHDREYHNFILYKIMTNCAYKVHTTHINIYVCVWRTRLNETILKHNMRFKWGMRHETTWNGMRSMSWT